MYFRTNLAVLLSSLLTASAFSQVDTVVSPFDTIDLTSEGGSELLDIRRIDAIRVSGGYLLALARLGPQGHHQMIRLSLDRKERFNMPVDERGLQNWLDVDDQGNCYLARIQSHSGARSHYHDLVRLTMNGVGGVVKEIIPTGEFLRGFAVHDNQVVYATADGNLLRAPAGAIIERAGAIPLFTLFRFRAGGTLVMVEGASGRVRFLDATTSNAAQRELELKTPELGALRARNARRPDAAQALLIGSMSIAENDHIFLNLASGFSASKGAVVLELNRSDSLVRRWICQLPTRPEYVSAYNRRGAIISAHIEVANGILYLGDFRGTIAKYNLKTKEGQ